MFLGPVRLSWAGSGPVNSPYVGTPGAAGEEGAFSLTRRNLRLEHPMQGAGACMQAPHLLCFLSTHRLWLVAEQGAAGRERPCQVGVGSGDTLGKPGGPDGTWSPAWGSALPGHRRS